MTNPQSPQFLWRNTAYAAHYFQCERTSLVGGLRQAVGPQALQVGRQIDQSLVDEIDFPFLVKASSRETGDSDIIVDPAFLPFAPESFATVILPHVLEGHELPHQVLREAHRVLMPEGHIVVTGFNPMSFMGMQRLFRPKAVMPGRYYTPKRVIDWLQLLGFDMVASAMFQYAPLSSRRRMKVALRFMESIGDRWLPMFGGGYMLTAKKRDVGTTLIGRARFIRPKPKLAIPASAQTLLNADHNNPN